MKSVRNIRASSGGLGQVSGSKALIYGIGDWPVVLGQKLITLPETLVMLGNPTSTLGGNALKDKSGYRRVTHEMNDFLRIEVDKQSFTFSVSDGTLRIYNGLDYVPILTWI